MDEKTTNGEKKRGRGHGHYPEGRGKRAKASKYRTGLEVTDEMKRAFRDEKTAIDYLFENGILPMPDPKLKCPTCGRGAIVRPSNVSTTTTTSSSEDDDVEKMWICNNENCGIADGETWVRLAPRWSRSIFHGTYFARAKATHAPVHKLLEMLHMQFHRCEPCFIVNCLRLSPVIVADWMLFGFELVSRFNEENLGQVGGENIEVQIYGTELVRTTQHHRGRHVEESVRFFGGIEHTSEGHLFGLAVEDRSSDTLLPIIAKYVAPKSIVISNSWEGYDGIEHLMPQAYQHITVKHPLKDPINGKHINKMKGTWSALKRIIINEPWNETCVNGHVQMFIFKKIHRGQIWEKAMLAIKTLSFLADDDEPTFRRLLEIQEEEA